ncbi:hypothetical protein HY992_04275 [Candidatus Micrarchaeota archaeon]|nr:hypothetical protein [Candidatus Micrarchaeota archaeon]
MNELSEENLVEIDNVTKQKVDATIDSIEYALQGWEKEKKTGAQLSEKMEKLQKWRDALKKWNETHVFKKDDEARTRLERLKAFYDICRELGAGEN